MEKKRWVLIFSALCLALVFSVSSVEAQEQCSMCGSCDRDGDLLIRGSRNCIRKCGISELEADPDDSDAGLCTGEDDPVSLYSVELFGPVTGGPNTFEGGTSGGDTIHLPNFNPSGMTLDLTDFLKAPADGEPGGVFYQEFGDPGSCFSDVVELGAAQIRVKKLRGGAVQTEAWFWFSGQNMDASIPVSYLFIAFGTLDDSNSPGPGDMTMRDWEMNAEGNGRRGSTNACLADGPFIAGDLLDIEVFQTQ